MRPLALALTLTLAATTARAQSPRSLWAQAVTPGSREADSALRRAQRLLYAVQLYEQSHDPQHRGALRVAPELGRVNGNLAIPRHMAIAMLESAATTRPDHLETLTTLAGAYQLDGRYLLSDATAARALALSPPAPVELALRNLRAVVLAHLDRPAEARDEYLRALALPTSDRGRAFLLGNLADTLAQLGDLDAAIARYRECVALHGGYGLAWLGLAVTLDRAGQPSEREADRAALVASHLARAVRASGDFPMCPDDTAALACELERPEVFFVPSYDFYAQRGVAHEAIARALDRGPEADPAAAARHRAQARADWERFLTLAPTDSPWRAQAERHRRSLE
ncbi:MAG: tetratricopeptide repeat protein [Polyangiales bacterium]